MIERVAIGLGGNVGDVVGRFERAREALGARRSASLYRSAPIGPEQDDYWNSVVIVDGAFTPSQLIAWVLEIEALLGRDRRGESRWGPRPIDLDVLCAIEPIDFTSRDPAIELPHPRMFERRFVLDPLAELLGDDFAIAGRRLGELRLAVRGQRVDRIGPW